MANCHSNGDVSTLAEIFPRKSRFGKISIAPLPQLPKRAFTLALVGNPNAGKTTLFNALTGLRAKTANFPGTTVEQKIGRATIGQREIIFVDLPGLYGLESSAPEEKLAADALRGRLAGQPAPDAVLVVVDATNLERNLFLAGEVLELKRPVIIALNMMDMAERDGIRIDVEKLRAELGCVVVPIAARSGKGIDDLRFEIERLAGCAVVESAGHFKTNCVATCSGCPYQKRYEWTESVSARVMNPAAARRPQRTEKLDKILTHPVFGVAAFLAVMVVFLFLIFWVAKIPMNLIDHLFATIGTWVAAQVTQPDLQSLLVNGVIGGVGGVLVFLPQIVILFFALSLLEDTGYLARAAFVMDKIMRKLGLPGKAFVPLLSAHACAIPAVMSARVVENPRDRLATILVAPLMACSARIPIYAMITALLFPQSPFKAALVFTGAYAIGNYFCARHGVDFSAHDFARRQQTAGDRIAAVSPARFAHGVSAHVRPRQNFRETGGHDHPADFAAALDAVALSKIRAACCRCCDDRTSRATRKIRREKSGGRTSRFRRSFDGAKRAAKFLCRKNRPRD